jgi:hypothetical protein
LAAFKKAWSHCDVAEPLYAHGEYHPRMWRPHAAPSVIKAHFDEWRASVQSGRIVLDKLGDILRYIEPDPAKTFDTYGHELRHLLILAATEVEAAWKGVLRANGYVARDAKTGKPRKMTRIDYVKCVAPMRLSDWTLSMPMWRHVPALQPFGRWGVGAKLPWYDAYNAVKHDAEAEFHQATLEHVISACGAVFVMVLAQFGTWRAYGGPLGHELSTLSFEGPTIFAVQSPPTWPLAELYVPPTVIRDGTDWHPKAYPF